jgi:choloylglycine hydrolase
MRKGRGILLSLCAGVCAFLTMVPDVHGCTSLLIPTKDGGYVYGRTLEFALNLDSDVIVIPRGYQLQGTGPDGKPGSGLSYTTKYGVVGLNGLKLPIVVDGMNEKGLVAGALYLPGFSLYQDTAPTEGRNSLASYEALTYILTNYASVDEVKAGLSKIKVNRSEHPVFKGVVPLHYTVHDSSGKSIVIEYIGGVLQITDNPTHVMTNGPEIGWHLRNIGLYLNIKPGPLTPVTIGGMTVQPPSTGANMVGLPGDMSAPGRFVRAVFFSQAAPVAKNGEEGVNTVFHIMNNFDIPPGAITTSAKAAAGGGIDGVEITEWTSVADMKNKVFYIRTYDSLQTHKVVLSAMPLDGKAIRYISLNQGEGAVELK